jgi:hypothetical protein
MTAHITKTWFDGEKIVTQNIPESEIYKPEWVGLTDEEIWSVYTQVDSMQYMEFSHAIEARLKEKNNG